MLHKAPIHQEKNLYHLDWSNLSPVTDPLETVSVLECNIAWTAQPSPSKSLAGVGAEDQWAVTAIDWNPSLVSSGGSVIVAVIDSGVDYNNIQLKDAIWKNPGEKLNGLDDDGNGYIDDIQGWNFIADNNDPLDDYGHGTMTAGIIAARPINGKGIFGVNPRATIMNMMEVEVEAQPPETVIPSRTIGVRRCCARRTW